jgi:hypothetical protein
MILTSEKALWLYKCVATGPIDKAKIVVFGNEWGTGAGAGNTEKAIDRFINEFKTRKVLKINDNYFSIIEIDPPPVNSTFLQFISRLSLALKHKDERFFDVLSTEGWIFLNNYIMNSLYREDTAIINMKPLPQTTERVWDYDNINESEYSNMYNFQIKHYTSKYENYRKFRLQGLKAALDMAKNALILGSGDKHNKKAFFETLYPEIRFSEITLNSDLKIYFSEHPKIIISNYYDNRSGIKLSGLKEIYDFIIKNSLA